MGLGMGRERGSLAFQLRKQSVHIVGDGGGKWKRRDAGAAMKTDGFYGRLLSIPKSSIISWGSIVERKKLSLMSLAGDTRLEMYLHMYFDDRR